MVGLAASGVAGVGELEEVEREAGEADTLGIMLWKYIVISTQHFCVFIFKEIFLYGTHFSTFCFTSSPLTLKGLCLKEVEISLGY